MYVTKRKTVAFIPVRGGSKSIPLKNIKPFCGKPLVYWTVRAASNAKGIDEVYVATDSNRIREVVESFRLPKVEVIARSSDTATDTASTESAMLEFAEQREFDDIILIQATSPLLTAKDLDGGLGLYRKEGIDSLLSVVPQKRFIWQPSGSDVVAPMNYDVGHRPRRQEFDAYYVENGAFYICAKEALLSTKCRLNGTIGAYQMPEDAYFEIDEPSDWIVMESLMKKRGTEVEVNKLAGISLLVTDVDGVLTDAGMYYDQQGDALKKFNTHDGMGISRLREHGIKTMILTGEETGIVASRARKMNVDFLYQGIKDKKKFLQEFIETHREYVPEDIAYIGDDLNDREAMMLVGYCAAPADALPEIREQVDYVCRLGGGEGCVRELADRIIATKQHEIV